MKIKSILIVVFFLFTLTSSGQIGEELNRINSDSLLKILPKLEGNERIDALNQIAFDLSRDKSDTAILISNETKKISENINYQKGIADACLNLGLTYLYLDSLKTSIAHLLNAQKVYEEIDTCLGMGLTYVLLGGINHMTGRYDEGKAYRRKAYKVYNMLRLKKYLVLILIANGLSCTLNKEFDSSKYYYGKCLALIDKYQLSQHKQRLYLNMGFNLSWENQLMDTIINNRQDIINLYLKALDLSEKEQDSIALGLVLYNLSYQYRSTGTNEGRRKGLETALRAIDYGETHKIWPQALVGAYRQVAFSEYYEGNIIEAISLTEKAIRSGKARMNEWTLQDFRSPLIRSNVRHWLKMDFRWCYNELYRYYKEIGDYKKAMEYYILKEETDREIAQQENKNLITVLETEYENDKIENQIAMLERDKHFNELKAQQTRNLNIGIIIAFITLVLVGMLFLRQNKLKNDHKNTLLEQKLLRLQMNPHFIFNALSSIHSLMNPKEVNKASDYLGNFSRLLRTSLESSREDYILLEDEVNSMKNYLELQKLRYDSKFDYKIEVDQGIDLESAIIPPMLIQPFIENAIEHGIRHKEEPGHIHIRFRLDDKKISCEIEDNGIGRDKAWEAEYAKKGKHKSLATEINRDRINILNKKLKQKIDLNITDLKSEANEAMGTLVRLDLPYLLD